MKASSQLSKGFYFGIIIINLILIPSCSNKSSRNLTTTSNIAEMKTAIIKNYCSIVFANYQDALSSAIDLNVAIAKFIQQPSDSSLTYAKNMWIKARIPYAQSEAFRFYDGPIDNSENDLESYLNAWPLDEIYVDYTIENKNAGIINDISNFPLLNKDILEKMNENGGENNISTGYHAIEFLLWGQDNNAHSPGNRPYTDYIPSTLNSERRAQYLKICSDILIDQLTQLENDWDVNKPNSYANIFINLDVDEAVQKMLTGLSNLSKIEMAGERMYTAYDNKSQEDEQSCFSDNTKNDLINNQLGIFNVYDGKYVSKNGTQIHGVSISDLMNIINPTINSQMLQSISDAEENLSLIFYPFDQAIVLESKRPAVLMAIKALQKEGNLFIQIAENAGVIIDPTPVK